LSITSTDYVGRFAPSPSGDLHFGSLVTAVASFADALHENGQWILRIDDIDTPRVAPGSADRIVHSLAGLGFEWAGAIRWQSQRLAAYEEASLALLDQQLAYPCRCSRRDIELISEPGREGPIYPGTCRLWNGLGDGQRAIRLRTDSALISFTDRAFGRQQQNIEHEVGDFVIRRADNLTAYQLAVVVDDALDRITHVVRGADLLLSTPRQIYLCELLDYETPVYLHVPLAKDANGKKISKSDNASALNAREPLSALQSAWRFLGQPALDRDLSSPAEFWVDARDKWSVPALAAHTQNTV